MGAASSVPDFVGQYDSVGNRNFGGNQEFDENFNGNYEFDEESFEEIVQQDYGFLYYNNNPARKIFQSWTTLEEDYIAFVTGP